MSIPEAGPSAGAHGDAHTGGGARALDHQAGAESGQAAAQVQHGGGRGLLPVPDGTMELRCSRHLLCNQNTKKWNTLLDVRC